MAKKKKTKKKATRLSDKEKKIIKVMTRAGATMREIAKKIGRVPSTVWRWQQER
jgi:IS30 family transposase